MSRQQFRVWLLDAFSYVPGLVDVSISSASMGHPSANGSRSECT